MSGGPRYEYLWADNDQYKKPTALAAPKYIEQLMDWTEAQINDEAVFPVSTNTPFPRSFVALCRKILARLFRVFVHVYIHHFDRIVSIGAVRFYSQLIDAVDIFNIHNAFVLQEAHVNTCYKHFYYFVQEFELVSQKELDPLFDMTNQICKD